jgi:SAM-dependent methyltransferase
MPLSNSLASTREEALLSKQFPLKVLFCEDCFLSQLSIVIDPEVMFSNYVYRSSINKGYVEHCRKMAKDLKVKYKLNQASFMLDIAGNDCALLKEFQKEIGLSVLNVDPAKNLIKICLDDDIPAISKFWGIDTAKQIIGKEGRADLITATNVFAHCDDVKGFIEAAKYALKPNGVLVLEFPYLVDFIEKVEFDTIYFEHLSYFSITPLYKLCHDWA